MEKMPDPRYTLETEFRNPLQALIMMEMLGEKIRDPRAQEEWAAEYASKISDVIDTPEHADIRELARKEKYEEAMEKVLEVLGLKLKKAA